MGIITTALNLWSTFLGRAIISIILAVLAYLLLRFAVPWATRRTRYEIDDIIVGILRWPITLIVLFSGLVSALPLTDLPKNFISIVNKVYAVLLVLALAYLLLRLFSDVLARYIEEYARESESNVDDVLAPLLTRRVIPLVIVIGAAIAILGMLGIELGGVLTALGALSFLLIFLFQEPLSNLFSGVYLVMDAPFKYGDLIILEDEKTYRVEEIGVRVTKLYNTDDHTLAYMPNNKLAGQRIINLTRPNVELRLKMPIGVTYETKDLDRVQKFLVEAASAHPHVLARWEEKREAMARKLQNMPDGNEKTRFQMEMERLETEEHIREQSETIIRRLQFLAQFVSRLEKGGLDPRERERIHAVIDTIWPDVNEMRRELTIWLHLVGRLDATYKWDGVIVPLTRDEIRGRLPSVAQLEQWRRSEAKPDEIRVQLLEQSQLAVLGTFADVDEEFFLAGSVSWLEFSKDVNAQGVQASIDKSLAIWIQEQPTWDAFKDFYTFYGNWHKPVRDLLHRLDVCSRPERLRGEEEFRLDDRIRNVVSLLEDKFLLRTPGWKQPDADFIGFGASSIDFRLEFFVDDLVREHFERLDDVISEVGLDIIQRFNAEGIGIPFPQTAIFFKDEWLKEVVQKYRTGFQ